MHCDKCQDSVVVIANPEREYVCSRCGSVLEKIYEQEKGRKRKKYQLEEEEEEERGEEEVGGGEQEDPAFGVTAFVKEVSARHHLLQCITDRALYWLRYKLSAHMSKNRESLNTRNQIAAAFALYMACGENDSPRCMEDIAHFTHTLTKDIYALQTFFPQSFTVRPSDLVGPLAYALQVNRRSSLRLAREADAMFQRTNHSAKKVLAAIFAREYPEHMESIANFTGILSYTVRKCLTDIQNVS